MAPYKRSYSAISAKPGASSTAKEPWAESTAKKLRFESTPAHVVLKPLEKLPPLQPPSVIPKAPVTVDPRAAPLALEILKDSWGFSAFRLAQEAAISHLISGGSAVAVFPTGGGKSLVYQVPALAFDKYDEICGRPPGRGLTLIVSPLIALMKDQTEALKKRGIKAATIDSSQDRQSVLDTYDSIRSGELKLLYVAPERLNNEGFVETIKRVKIRMVAVDEAHCVSSWGHAFRPDYLKVARFIRETNVERVLCLTATATPKVADDILNSFGIEPEGLFRTTTFRPNLRLLAMPVESKTAKISLLKNFLSKNPGPSIVYVTTHMQAVETANALKTTGFNVAAYHAGLSANIRTSIQDSFMESSNMIIVATIAFGMGIDKADIRNVVHYTIPQSLEGYSQEIGRAGRDGKPSTCMLYLSTADIKRHEFFSRADVPSLRSVHGCVNAFCAEWPHAETDHVVEASMPKLEKDWDIRPVTLSLLFAQLELQFGLIRAITPKYSVYTYVPTHSFAALDKSDVVSIALLKASKKAKTLTHIDVDEAARICSEPRGVVVRKLQSWSEYGAIELRPSGVVSRFRVLKAFPSPVEIQELAEKLQQKMEDREKENIQRVKDLVDLLTGYECLAQALAGYFGDEMEEPCGLCSFCSTNAPIEFEWPGKDEEDTEVDMVKVRSVLDAVGEANWDDARFLARIAWGVRSPRIKKLGVASKAAWGCCEGVPFEKLVKAFEAFCKR